MVRSKRYLADNADDIGLLINTPAQAESSMHSLEQSTKSTGRYMNANITEYMCFKQKGAISALIDKPLLLVD